MSDVRLVGAPTDGADTTTVLQIAWTAGTGKGSTLPTTYFEKVTSAAPNLVEDAKLTGEREMTVTIDGALAEHAGQTVTFSLFFPDRREFISCTHGGMPDQYSLKVTVTFSSDGSNATATFEQAVALGDY